MQRYYISNRCNIFRVKPRIATKGRYYVCPIGPRVCQLEQPHPIKHQLLSQSLVFETQNVTPKPRSEPS